MMRAPANDLRACCAAHAAHGSLCCVRTAARSPIRRWRCSCALSPSRRNGANNVVLRRQRGRLAPSSARATLRRASEHAAEGAPCTGAGTSHRLASELRLLRALASSVRHTADVGPEPHAATDKALLEGEEPPGVFQLQRGALRRALECHGPGTKRFRAITPYFSVGGYILVARALVDGAHFGALLAALPRLCAQRAQRV